MTNQEQIEGLNNLFDFLSDKIEFLKELIQRNDTVNDRINKTEQRVRRNDLKAGNRMIRRSNPIQTRSIILNPEE